MKLSELCHVDVSNIMQGNRKAVLMHNHKQYLLSITRRGKLILTLTEEKTDSANKVPNGDIGLMVS